MPRRMTFPEYLVWLGDTPAEYAERIGVSRQAVERYRDGKRIPRPKIMARILKEANGRLSRDSFEYAYAQAA